MATVKTKQTTASVEEFINSFADTVQKRNDAFKLSKIISDHTGYKATMWGPSIIGFGVYHYKSDKSRQEADWPLVGFSPRKPAISLYVYANTEKNQDLLHRFGKFKKGKGCIYIKKLSDIDVEILKEMIDETIRFLQEKHGKTA